MMAIESGVKVFFADPHSPWKRGTNGLLRQYFPKKTDSSRWSEQGLEAVALTINNRPRKTLSWKTPAEALNDYLQSVAYTVLRRPVECAQYCGHEYLSALKDYKMNGSLPDGKLVSASPIGKDR